MHEHTLRNRARAKQSMRTLIHACMHTHVHTHGGVVKQSMRTLIHACMHTHCAIMHGLNRACVHSYTHACTHSAQSCTKDTTALTKQGVQVQVELDVEAVGVDCGSVCDLEHRLEPDALLSCKHVPQDNLVMSTKVLNLIHKI